MKKVRFLEGCYMFSTQKFYNMNDITMLDKKQADDLYTKELIDILDDEEFVDEKELEKEIKENTDKPSANEDLESLTVPKLQEIAIKKDIEFKGLRKAELVEALQEVI